MMKVSGRNKFEGTVKEVKNGAVMAKVVVDCQGKEIVSMITIDSVEDLGLKVGDKVSALIKSTDVMVIK